MGQFKPTVWVEINKGGELMLEPVRAALEPLGVEVRRVLLTRRGLVPAPEDATGDESC